MSKSDQPFNVAILALPEATASVIYGMHDLFYSAGRDWELLVQGTAGESRFYPYVVSADGKRFSASNDVWIEPSYSFDNCPRPHVICVPELAICPHSDPRGQFKTETAWVSQSYTAGAIVVTACSGALLLAEAGLLDERDATTHWGYVNSFQTWYPKVRLQPKRALVVSGDEQRLIMAGGGTSWLDVALYIIAQLTGVETAMGVAKVNLIDWHDVGQQPFASLCMARQSDDAVVSQCQVWAANNYQTIAPVSAMVELSGLSERTFKRRFVKATGLAPLEYIHTLRLEESKHMLETGNLPVEAIANEVGYEDSSFFGRLFRRKVGMTPAQYRKRFGQLRKRLEAVTINERQ
jgi:transcriptional regulator GlxA family with amidase domain